MNAMNPDYTDFIYLGASSAVPARVPPHEIYGFAPMAPGTLANEIHQGSMEATAEGLGPLAPAVAPAAPAAAPAPPPAVPLPGALGGGAMGVGAPQPHLQQLLMSSMFGFALRQLVDTNVER